MKVYIAGPMSGIPQFNYPAFAQLAKELRKVVTSPGEHIEVMSPPEMDPAAWQKDAMMSRHGDMDEMPAGTPSHGAFIGLGVQRILDGGFDAIVVLPDWHLSRGARVEVMAGLVSGATITKPEYYYGGRINLYEMPRSEMLRGLEGEA